MFKKFGHVPTEILERLGLSNLYILLKDTEATRTAMIALAAARQTKYTTSEFNADYWRITEKKSKLERAAIQEAKKRAEAEDIVQGGERMNEGEEPTPALQHLLNDVWALAQKLPNDAARFIAVEEMGLSVKAGVEEALHKYGRSEIAMRFALIFHAHDLWDLVIAYREPTADRPRLLPPPAAE